jgi:hypothetical protein
MNSLDFFSSIESKERGAYFCAHTLSLCPPQPMLACKGTSLSTALAALYRFSADFNFLEFFPADLDVLSGSERGPNRHGGMILLLHAIELHVFTEVCIFAAYGLDIFCLANVLNLHNVLLVARQLFGAPTGIFGRLSDL